MRDAPAPAAALRGLTGVVRNPMSKRNRTGRTDAWWRDLDDPLLVCAEPASPEDLVGVLRDFARREVALLVVDGGDGTVREVLSALPAAYGDRPPAVAVLASGTTNLIAADVGAGRADPSTLAMLRQIARGEAAPARIERRSTLEVSWPDGSRPPVVGMFVGACAFTRATDLSVSLVREGRVEEGAGVAVTLLSVMAKTLAGSEREQWLAGEMLGIGVDGRMTEVSRRFLFLSTTLNKLMLGLWPFWGEGSGAIRYLDIAAPPKRLAVALPAVLRARPRPWMPDAGYRSGMADALDLLLEDRFVIDGEFFTPGEHGRVRLAAGPTIDFVVP
jgi:hypothetical protein